VDHDHGHLSRRIATISAEFTALRASGAPSGPIADDVVQALVALSEELFEHFAREEEGLFPLIIKHAPDLAPTVAALVEGHDRICGAASRLLALRDRAPTPGTIELAASLFQRFEEVYAEHTGREMEVLASLGPRLDAAARAEIAAQVADADAATKA
jgi:iron-sulfur cluster repair protein YtfE (RIC family)